MTEIRKIQCDRCKTEVDLERDDNRPDRWTFLSDKDLCPSCHTEYKAQLAQAQDFFFKKEDSPVMKVIVAARSLACASALNSLPELEPDVQTLRDALRLISMFPSGSPF